MDKSINTRTQWHKWNSLEILKLIYDVGLGSNSYLSNYFIHQFYSTSKKYIPEQYVGDLIPF